MSSELDNREAFLFDLSAFLAAARSVLQYGKDEAQQKKGGQAWYDTQVNSHPLMGFFKDKRDLNIHSEPVGASSAVEIEVTDEAVGLSDSVTSTVFDRQGNVVHQSTTGPPPVSEPPSPGEGQMSVTFRHYFADWKGKDDVLTLAGRYLDELKSFVAAGQSKGFLSRPT
jgi:hypothetical protein